MKQSEIMYHRCKRIAGNNTTALNALLAIDSKGRTDILDMIFKLIQHDSNAITPEGIANAWISSNKDVNTLLKMFDKGMKNAAKERRNWYNCFEQDVEQLQHQLTTGEKPEEKREFYTSKYHKYEG
jgi:plasmid replication initiation protein